MPSRRTQTFSESVIREMSRVAAQHGAINLAQGFPDFPMPSPMKDAACAAIHGDLNQYAVTWGSPPLRLAIAEKYRRWYEMPVDSETEVTVTCGATEAMAAVFLALVDPGDEVIIFEPYYENYGPDAILADAKPVFVPLLAPDWRIDEARLRAAFTAKTKAIVVNTPHNPTGRVFTREEIGLIAELCVAHDVYAITDEIYEHIRYAGNHHPIATWPGMRERTITVSGLSKTFSCTGWRLGYAIAPEDETRAIRKVHDFLTVGAPAPLQAAGAVGMAFDADYYNHLALDYRARRDLLCGALAEAGFTFSVPEGAYYVLAGFSAISDLGDVEFAKWMAAEVGVVPVPGSSFYHKRALGRGLVRFAFCKRAETLERAAERLAGLPALA
ncbi:MAG: Aspartate aminotransferase [uncultured Gemmatimonadaceae bacterium]|uniref:Aspartate aminotransferase n=1 Tax=uncultured Gemmatimonadaceae bacterium TaxID=246130 RepID=A0A6J4M650_9BACT|nr:MAG: Aspartate aminotransferase [uncultured Gemmatimonadaceae bacterium]